MPPGTGHPPNRGQRWCVEHLGERAYPGVGRVSIGVEGAFEASRSQRWAALAVLAEFSERPGTFDRHIGAQFGSYLRIVHIKH